MQLEPSAWTLLCLWLSSLTVALPVLIVGVGSAHGADGVTPSAAALELMAATAPEARRDLEQPFTDAARSDWHYTPRRRSGVAWRDMNAAQRAATTKLLRTALSEPGLDKVRAIMALEIALRQMETFGSSRDPENYAVAIFGTPSAQGSWGWRIEGHHLSLHFTLRGDQHLATLPQFMGSNPALVPRDFEGGPRKGARVLGKLEDQARQILDGLDVKQRAAAVIDERPYGDIVTRNAAKLSPLAPSGIAFAQLPHRQQSLIVELIGAFADHLRPELAEARLARVRQGGLDSIRFAWAGSTVPGKPHYFRIQGRSFLIEYDNSGGNHVHSVWRDFEGDWGRDALGDHYAKDGPHGH